MSDTDVERMRQEAEEHAAEDKAKREVVDLKNQADQIVHETRKHLTEHKDKLEAGDVTAIEEACEALEKAAQGEDKAVIEAALQDLQQKAQKLGEVLYAQQQADGGSPPPDGPAPAGEGDASGSDEPVDADFEVKS